MKFFIMAGGYGKRIEPLSDFLPKSLLPLNGKSLLDRMLNQLFKVGFQEGFINIHHKAEIIREHLSSRTGITIFHENNLTGNKILKQAHSALESKALLVVNGDILLDIPVQKMKKMMNETGADCVLLVKKVKDPQYRTLEVKGHRFLKRNPLNQKGGREGIIFAGVFLINKKCIAGIDELNVFDYFEKTKFKIDVCFLESEWFDIGSPQLYFEADGLVRKKESGELKNSISPGVVISDDSDLCNTIIWEKSVIKNSRINNSIITGNINITGLNCSNKIISSRDGRLSLADY